jgi:hypothetical protein
MCFVFCTTFVRNIFRPNKHLTNYAQVRAETRVGLHVKCPLFCLILTLIEVRRQILVKLPSIKFYETLVSDYPYVSCRRTDGRGTFNRRFVRFGTRPKRME